MAWARLDDSFYDHPKVMSVWHRRPDALGLHMRAIAYCARHSTDGWIHPAVVMALSPLQSDREQQVEVLVEERLWVKEGEQYGIHNYLDYNFSKAEIEKRREEDRKRKEERRKK
mgnify:CR=1 FL=1